MSRPSGVADEVPDYLNFSPESLGGGSVRMLFVPPSRAALSGLAAIRRTSPCGSARSGGPPLLAHGPHWEVGRPCPSFRKPLYHNVRAVLVCLGRVAASAPCALQMGR